MEVIIKANNISTYFEIQGKGEDLVLIHGAADNMNVWYCQVPVLSRGYRVISYDIRGHGKTEYPGGDFSTSLLVEDAYTLLQSAGIATACFLGYSLGGSIALGIALKYPEKVRTLILSNTPVGCPPSLFFQERQRSNAALLARGDITTMAENLTRDAFSEGFRERNPAEFEKYMKIKLMNKAEGLAGLQQLSRPSSTAPDLGALQCPVLIILGENDIYMDIEQVKKACSQITNAEVIILPTSHASPIEAPQEFNFTVLKFLAQLRNK
jgi:3-oxoadipate enol-lactonase